MTKTPREIYLEVAQRRMPEKVYKLHKNGIVDDSIVVEAMEEYAAYILSRQKIPLTEEKKLELILQKYHGHTKEQWENEVVKQYPYCEIPYLVDMVWEAAQGNEINTGSHKTKDDERENQRELTCNCCLQPVDVLPNGFSCKSCIDNY